MSSESPASELYSSSGVELSIQNNVAIPAGTCGLLSVGTDGTNSHFIKVDSSGNTIVGGNATATAPTYTTGTLNPLSLTIAGALRVDASGAHIKGTLQPLYGTNGQVITITLAGQANGGAQASTAVDNTTILYEDVLLFFKYTTGTGVSATGYVNVYGYGSVDGTTYPEGITGTNAAVTLTSPSNLVLIAQINANTVATKTFGPISFCRMYGLDKLPSKWGVVVQNETGATANATAGNFAITYQGVNSQLV